MTLYDKFLQNFTKYLKLKINKKGIKKMEQIIWAKTILKVYRYIDKAIILLDKAVEKLSLRPDLTATDVTNRLLNLTERKVNLINLKLIVEKVLASCSVKHLRVLSLKYIQDLKSDEIAEHFNKSRRTIFRLINDAFNEFVKKMLGFGFCSNFLYKHLKTEKWILMQFGKEYLKLQTKEQKVIKVQYETDDMFSVNYAFNQFRKSLS